MKIFLLLLLSLFIANCTKNADADLGQPAILSFTQHIDTTGAEVTIVGRNFSKTPSHNKVTFNTAATKAFFSTGDTLRVMVPTSATTGLIGVTVNNKNIYSVDTFYVGTGRWRKMADFPGGPRCCAVGFSIGNKGYIAGGSGTQNYSDLWEYDMALDKWTRRADFPDPSLNDAVCFVLSGKAYVGFGRSNIYPYSPTFYAYDPQTDTWTQKTGLTYGVFSNLKALSIVVGGKGYLLQNPGGNAVYSYDPALDQWTTKAGFPGGGRNAAAGFSIGNKGFLVGGAAGNTGADQKDCWEYDPGTDQWTAKTGPRIEIYDDVGFSINGRGYVGNDFFFQKLFLEYDPVGDSWSLKAPFPGLASGGAASFVLNDTAFVATGQYSNTITSEVWRFVP